MILLFHYFILLLLFIILFLYFIINNRCINYRKINFLTATKIDVSLRGSFRALQRHPFHRLRKKIDKYRKLRLIAKFVAKKRITRIRERT